jgi:hypothetical protein
MSYSVCILFIVIIYKAYYTIDIYLYIIMIIYSRPVGQTLKSSSILVVLKLFIVVYE